jgi:hypothetical protein
MTQFRMTVKPAYRHNVSQQYHTATDNLKRNIRNQLRGLGREWKRLMQDEAPEGKTGKFKKGIGFRTFARGEDRFLMIGHMPQPLGTYITEGTKPHWIQAKNRRALSFFWPKIGMRVIVPKRGGFKTHVRNDVFWIGKGGVNHPGTKANPFHKRAYRRWRPKAKQVMRRITHHWQADFTS